MKIIELESVDSTNEYIKRGDFDEDTAVIAKRQTGGRGTKGRSFSSEDGGLYISVLRCHKNFPAADAFKVMIGACVAVCKTLESLGLNPVIRWANDVLINGKKICGTLIENTFSGGNISRSITGMGININNELPPELKNIATSAKCELDRKIPIDTVKNTLLSNLEKSFTVKDYKKYINWFNGEITVKTDKESYVATALDVEEDGRLLVERGGNTLRLCAAEVSLRL